jgi:hypothetical protein
MVTSGKTDEGNQSITAKLSVRNAENPLWEAADKLKGLISDIEGVGDDQRNGPSLLGKSGSQPWNSNWMLRRITESTLVPRTLIVLRWLRADRMSIPPASSANVWICRDIRSKNRLSTRLQHPCQLGTLDDLIPVDLCIAFLLG